VCGFDAAAAREAFDAGAWPEACRVLLEEHARADRADQVLFDLSLSVLAELVPHSRGGAPRPATAAQPGLAAALAGALGRAAGARAPLGGQAPWDEDAQRAADAVAVLEAVLAGSDGAQRAVEFVDAGGAGHMVRGALGKGAWALQGSRRGGRTGLRFS
jgi:hypothetical protein